MPQCSQVTETREIGKKNKEQKAGGT